MTCPLAAEEFQAWGFADRTVEVGDCPALTADAVTVVVRRSRLEQGRTSVRPDPLGEAR